MPGERINYPFGAMLQASVDMASASKEATELKTQFEAAMNALLHTWTSDEAAPQVQQVQRLWAQAAGELNQLLSRRGTAVEDSMLRMRSTDRAAAISIQA
ncbi:WXG100 family type VII secretion target [Kribbella sp. NPDC054772]